MKNFLAKHDESGEINESDLQELDDSQTVQG